MLLDEITNYISSAGFGTFGTNLFQAKLPAIPINCIVVYENFGQETMATLDLEIAHEFPEFQILVRHTLAVAARARSEAIYKVLTRVKNMYLNDAFYLTINPRSTPYFLENDENNNYLVTCRFLAMKVSSSTPVHVF